MSGEEEVIYGVNPVLESLRSEEKGLNKIYLLPKRGGKEIDEIRLLARRRRVTLLTAERDALDRMARTAKHQGVVGFVSAQRYREVEELLAVSKRRNEPAFLFILDEVEDPRNLGAIIRTADAAGAHGMIIPERRSAGLTAVVSKTSAGALAHFPVARVVNISSTLDRLKRENIWIVGVETGAKVSYLEYDFTEPVAVLIGGEGKGIHRKILEKCDQVVSLPMRGHVSSLNVSVAAGIVAYEILRQRANKFKSKGAS